MTSTRGCVATLGRAACVVLLSAAVLCAAACAGSEANDGDGVRPDGSILAPNADASDGAASADAPEDEDIPRLPCGFGNLCRPPVPFSKESVTAISGRSRGDVWASGSGGLLMHWNGHEWSLVESRVSNALTHLQLTADELWAASGTLLLRRRADSNSVQVIENVSGEEILWRIVGVAVLPGDNVYLVARHFSTGTGIVTGLDFGTAALTPVPGPRFSWSDDEQEPQWEASFLTPGKALWLVGNSAAVARYPVIDGAAGEGASSLGQGVMIPVASRVDLRAAWGSGEHLFAVGTHGKILHFDGAEWTIYDTGTSATLGAIFGLSPTDVWAAGERGTLFHFDGQAWSRIELGRYVGTLGAIWGSGPEDVWIGGEDRLFHWGPLP